MPPPATLSATRLLRYGSGRHVPTVVGDPGPLPAERRAKSSSRLTSPRDRLTDLALQLDENLDRSWAALVREVRSTQDVRLVLALQRFQVALEAVWRRPPISDL